MSLFLSEQFNVWFPAIVVGFFISLLVAALWDFIRGRFWVFVSRFRPGILNEVDFDNRYQSRARAEAEDHHREIIEKMNIFASILNLFVSPKSSNSSTTSAFDIEAQTEINPHHTMPVRTSAVEGTYTFSSSSENNLYREQTIQSVDCRPITIIYTAYFPDGTPKDVTRLAKRLYKRHAIGPLKRMKSSIIMQASIVIDPWVLAEIVEFAKHCMQKETRCIFQLENWAILYYNDGEVQMHLLKEGDVPVNIEARWQDGKTGITMHGLHLMGSQVKAGTKRTSKILQSVYPTTQGAGDLDELHVLAREFDILGEDSLICASKVVVVDGVSLIIRSEATCILPPREENALREAIWTRWLRISNSAKKMLRSLLFEDEDFLPEHAANRPELEFDPQQLELNVQHWKGLSEIELLNTRKEVLLYLQKQRASEIIGHVGPPSPHSLLIFVKDEYYLECWQEGLRVLNEVIHRNSRGSDSHTHIRVRGGILFLLGDFESALQDYDLAHLNTGGHQSAVLLERALVKCMLGRYSEAMQDIVAVITLNQNVNDIQELQTCIQQILDQQRAFRIVTESGSSSQRLRLPDQDHSMVKIPDLLTGDKWQSGEIGCLLSIFDVGTAGESMDVSRAACRTTTPIAEALKLQLKLTNYLQSLETNPRYHVRRISFIITLLEDECDPDDVVKPLRPEDQELLNWQAPTEDLQNDLQVGKTLISLSRRLLPYKNILHTLYSNVTDDDSCAQRRGPHPLSPYRHVSFRSAILTKHSDADGDVQTLFLYDGTGGDQSCWRRGSHEYIKLLVLPEARSPYRAFWLVQWDVVDMQQVSSDGQGDPDRGFCSNPTVIERKDNKKQFYGIPLSENENSPWTAEVAGADGNGLNRHRGSDTRTNLRMSIPANYKPQTSRQIVPRSGHEPGTSQYYGVRFRPDLQKWVGEIRVPESMSMFKEITHFIKRECKQYAASFNDSPSEQIIPRFRSPRIAEVDAAGKSSPTSDGNIRNTHHGSDARANPRMSIPVNEKTQTSSQTQPLRASGVDRVFHTISEIFDSGGDSTVDSSSMNAYERKSVDNFDYYNGDEEAVSGVLRSADANMGLSKEAAALCSEEESTFSYQFHCLQLEHTTPCDEKGITMKEWNQTDESQELKIKNGLQGAVKRGSYHDLSRSIFEQESAVRVGITHPNICEPLHQIFRTGLPATELMKHDLRSIIDSRLKGLPEGLNPFTWPVAVDIMLQIGEGMASLHGLNIVHRDLKSQNILCTQLPLAESGSTFRPEHYYSVEVADFGLAKIRIQSSDVETRMDGTRACKAPEMIEVLEFPRKADVYSFGMVCYEILTGKLPFEEYRNQGLSLHARRPLDNLIVQDVPETLKKLVHQCLNSNPARRPTFSHIVMKLMEILGRKS